MGMQLQGRPDISGPLFKQVDSMRACTPSRCPQAALYSTGGSRMSAFLMDSGDFDLIASAHIFLANGSGHRTYQSFNRQHRLPLDPIGGGKAVRSLLIEENWRSVEHLYGEGADRNRYQALLAAPWDFDVNLPDTAIIAKIIHCYVYQSCEHEGWKESSACDLIRRLETRLLERLPGYQEAPWGGYRRTPPAVDSIAARLDAAKL